jgi:flagellar protein FlgJ
MSRPVADASQTANSPSVYTDLNGLSALKRDAKAQSPETVRKVAQQFESIFAKMVLSSMRQANFGDQLFGSDQQQFYQGMFDDQLAVELTKGKGLGLADMLVQQLSRSGLVKGGDAAAAATGTTSTSQSATPGAAGNRSTGTGAASNASQNDVLSAASSVAKKSALAIGASAGADTKYDFLFDAARGAQSAGSAESATAAVASDTAAASDAADSSALTAPARFGSPQDFVEKLWPCAQEAGQALGIDPKHLLAQAALETGWGKSLPCDTDGTSSFNFFGIKAGGSWQGDSVSTKTLEFEGGTPVPRTAKFRAYDSPADSFRDYVEVLRNNPRFASALNTGSDAKAFASALQRGGYATDPRYAMKIETIAQNLPFSETALKSSAEAPMTSPTDLF